MANPDWNPDLYLRFERERELPVLDLLHRLADRPVRRGADLGCGPGNSTRHLRRHLGADARLVGVDVDAAMIESARASDVDAKWVHQSINDWAPTEPFDLIFSNAALQWVHGQDALLPRLVECLVPGGQLAAQIPTHTHTAVHQAIHQTIADGPWADDLQHLADTFEIREPSDYFDILTPHADVELWVTEYIHVLDGPDDIVRWIRGSGLRPFLQALRDGQQDDFLNAYTQRIHAAYPQQADGSVLFPFRRLFFIATRAG
ncbi:MAG: methyltransferase domain-containing protein [Planctomycetota bacterium]